VSGDPAAAPEGAAAKPRSCGTVVTDGRRLILGHATGGRHWDVPKGLPEVGETDAGTAARELFEETGIRADPKLLVPLRSGPYLPKKDLALFLLRGPLPDPGSLRCSSMVEIPGRTPFPELDAFQAVEFGRIGEFATERMAAFLAEALKLLTENGGAL